uniref:Uncharacterized protein n=1 Tax=Lepeophtheirus salmonis TaxID=72036 RepID=A0A0K2TC89_LEPSM
MFMDLGPNDVIAYVSKFSLLANFVIKILVHILFRDYVVTLARSSL